MQWFHESPTKNSANSDMSLGTMTSSKVERLMEEVLLGVVMSGSDAGAEEIQSFCILGVVARGAHQQCDTGLYALCRDRAPNPPERAARAARWLRG